MTKNVTSGFGRAQRPCAACTWQFRLINTQNIWFYKKTFPKIQLHDVGDGLITVSNIGSGRGPLAELRWSRFLT